MLKFLGLSLRHFSTACSSRKSFKETDKLSASRTEIFLASSLHMAKCLQDSQFKFVDRKESEEILFQHIHKYLVSSP